jgi:TrmH family RNA methyltransferase
LASLKQKKYREASGKYLVEGLRLCEEVLRSDQPIENVYFCPEKGISERFENLVNDFVRKSFEVTAIDSRSAQKISDTIEPQGIFAVVQKQVTSFDIRSDFQLSRLLALQTVNDPGNLGTLLRSAGWFGFEGVLLSPGCVEWTNPKVVRSSMGACFHLPVFEQVDLFSTLKKLKAVHFLVQVVDTRGERSYADVRWGLKNVLVFGSEATGVSMQLRELADSVVHIPRYGHGDSLNVSACAAIVMAKLCEKRAAS